MCRTILYLHAHCLYAVPILKLATSGIGSSDGAIAPVVVLSEAGTSDEPRREVA